MQAVDIDRKAPVVAEATATTTAAPEAVFAVLADIAGWSDVYPELKEISITEPVAVGVAFSFRTGPGRIESRVIAMEAPSVFAFAGDGMGAASIYVFRIEAAGDGATIRAAQSLSGMAVRTMRPMLQKISSASIQAWVERIVAVAEARQGQA